MKEVQASLTPIVPGTEFFLVLLIFLYWGCFLFIDTTVEEGGARWVNLTQSERPTGTVNKVLIACLATEFLPVDLCCFNSAMTPPSWLKARPLLNHLYLWGYHRCTQKHQLKKMHGHAPFLYKTWYPLKVRYRGALCKSLICGTETHEYQSRGVERNMRFSPLCDIYPSCLHGNIWLSGCCGVV